MSETVPLRAIGLRAPSWRTLCFSGVGAALIAIRSPPDQHRQLVITLCIYLAMMLVLVLVQAALRPGGRTALRFDDESVFLPLNATTSRGRDVRYDAIRSATFSTGGRWPRLALDAGDRVFAYPLRRFVQADATTRIEALLRERITALPDGIARWADIERLHLDAVRLNRQRPWATWSLSVTIVLVFALQRGWPHLGVTPDDGLADIDLGANASSLVRQGQLWRLVTASLMHASVHHLFSNLLSLLVIGTLLERLVGIRRFLLIALLSAILSEATSAALGPYLGGYLYSVGISGMVFGLIGALAAITWWLGPRLPAGFRLPPRVWLSLLGLNLFITLVVPQVDKGAHLGGLLVGAVLGWLMILRRRDLPASRAACRPTWLALAAVAGFWLLALVGAVRHVADPAARLHDRILLVGAELDEGRLVPAIENRLAYAVALQPMAGDAAWREARALATLARTRVTQDYVAAQLLPMIGDTVAVLDDRLGNIPAALREQLPLLDLPDPTIRMHMAAFLADAEKAGEPVELDGATAVPSLSLHDRMLQLRIPEPLPMGGEAVALLRQHGVVRGYLDLRLPPGASSATLRLPMRRPAGGDAGIDDFWLDGSSTAHVVLFEASGCRCYGSAISGHAYMLPHRQLPNVRRSVHASGPTG